ncbi:hypothetical protein ACQR1N_28375 [Bradyrhizobium sp. HKCCYLRH1073]
MANAAGLRQALISELEASKLDVRLDTLSRVCDCARCHVG